MSFPEALDRLRARLVSAPAPAEAEGPDPLVEWSLGLTLPAPRPLSRVQGWVTPAWLGAHGRPTVTVRQAGGPPGLLWSAAPPDPVDALALAWRIRPLDPREALDGPALLAAAAALAEAGGATLGAPSSPAAELPARRRALDALVRRAGLTIELAVMAGAGRRFPGPGVLHALTELGLEHGDMDLFHAPGPDGEGLLGVSPIDDPEWFEPAALAVDAQRPEGLLISFSVPRSPDPLRVMELAFLLSGALTARLGGEVHDLATSMPAEGMTLRARVRACVQDLEAAGFTPGGRAARLLF